jgi:hypothetical protein
MAKTIECYGCGGEGGHDVPTGYRQYGSGYGDCEETWGWRECPTCYGSGEVEPDEPDEPPPHTDDDAPHWSEPTKGFPISSTG